MPLPRRRGALPPPVLAGASRTAPRRPDNQDRWAVGPGWGIVCDGVGGHAGGARAASAALDVVAAHLAALERPPADAGRVREVLRGAADAANARVRAEQAADAEVADMATTLTAAVAVGGRGPRRGWVVLQLGDSPAWRVGPAAARSITWDHNLVGDLVRAGALEPERALGHRGRNVITRAIGVSAAVEPDVFDVDLAPDEWLVLASDGLSDVAPPSAAVGPCAAATDPEAAAGALVQLATTRGTMDDVTVVVAR